MPVSSRRHAVLGLGLALAAFQPFAALAQAAQTTRLRGSIVGLEGDVLTVRTREGGTEQVTLTQPLVVAALRRVQLSEIMPGTSLGVVATPGEGALRAVAITVLPPGVRINERQIAWDLAPNTSMNDGPVEAIADGTNGREITLSIRGQTVPVQVPADTPLVMPIAATREDLKPGAAVLINATRGADGKLSAARVTVGRDGVDPPI